MAGDVDVHAVEDGDQVWTDVTGLVDSFVLFEGTFPQATSGVARSTATVTGFMELADELGVRMVYLSRQVVNDDTMALARHVAAEDTGDDPDDLPDLLAGHVEALRSRWGRTWLVQVGWGHAGVLHTWTGQAIWHAEWERDLDRALSRVEEGRAAQEMDHWQRVSDLADVLTTDERFTATYGSRAAQRARAEELLTGEERGLVHSTVSEANGRYPTPGQTEMERRWAQEAWQLRMGGASYAATAAAVGVGEKKLRRLLDQYPAVTM